MIACNNFKRNTSWVVNTELCQTKRKFPENCVQSRERVTGDECEKDGVVSTHSINIAFQAKD